MQHQKLLFSLEHLFDINPLENYQLLFDNLDSSYLSYKSHPQGGRLPYNPTSLLKALIYKNLHSLNTLSELVNDLIDNPSISLKCGFDILKPLPSVERFSRFFKRNP